MPAGDTLRPGPGSSRGGRSRAFGQRSRSRCRSDRMWGAKLGLRLGLGLGLDHGVTVTVTVTVCVDLCARVCVCIYIYKSS